MFKDITITIIIFLVIAAVISSIVYWLAILYFRKDKNKITKEFNKSHEILYYFTAPALSLFAAILTLSVLVTQYQAIERQKEISSIEQFERYFQYFLTSHDNNLRNFQVSPTIRTIKEREAFFYMYWEYRSLLYILKNTADSAKIKLSPEDANQIAFTCFYYGVAENPDKKSENKTIKEELDSVFRKTHNATNINLLFKNDFTWFYYGVMESADKNKENKTIIDELDSVFRKTYNDRIIYKNLIESYLDSIKSIQKLNKKRIDKRELDTIVANNIFAKTKYLNEYIYSDDKILIFDGHLTDLTAYVQSAKGISDLLRIKYEQNQKYLSKEDFNLFTKLFQIQFSPHELVILKLYDDYYSFREKKKYFEDDIENFENFPQGSYNRAKFYETTK